MLSNLPIITRAKILILAPCPRELALFLDSAELPEQVKSAAMAQVASLARQDCDRGADEERG